MPKGTRYKHYTEQDRADAIAAVASTGNINGTAKKMGIAESTLRQWVASPEKQAPQEKLDGAKRDLLTELDKARWLYLDRLTETAAVQTTSGYYAAITFKTLNEAHQLLSGGPTARFSLADYLRGAGFGKTESVTEGTFKELPAQTGGT